MNSSAPVEIGRATRRYTLERMLGSGGMGAVYLARDHDTGEYVALKKLLHVDANSVLRLKREFRSVADMNHPNLVKLYDLELASDGWMLTMEHVEGQDLLSYVQQLGAWVDSGTIRMSTLLAGIGPSSRPPRASAATIPSLRPHDPSAAQTALHAFHQLACGVHALHCAGMLHRDLKPSNVLVANHRVVVLDFGLVRELGDKAASLTEAGAITGTPAYMAPEQALGRALSEATDWYAFGVMLYEALTGHLPFEGAMMELMMRKLEADPAPARELNPAVPAALSQFCMALLQRDPAKRPSGIEVLAQLEPASARPAVVAPARPVIDSLQPSDSTFQTETQTQAPTAPFFGRKPEVAALWQAMHAAEDGTTAVVHVRGPSGAGKSSLVERFLDEVESQAGALDGPDALVLRSRCYEREAMPFKALDSLMDAVVRHLAPMDDLQVGHLLPADIEVLAQLFPVLERLRAVQRLLMRRKTAGDGIHSRKRAEAALRDLIGRLAARRPLVIWIDDLQWGDLDSASLLKGWLQRPLNVPLLLVFSYRSEETETSPCLQDLLQVSPEVGAASAHVHTLDVAALAPVDLHALCRQRLGEHAHGHAALIERIAHESQGSPFLASQLAALAQAKITRGDRDVHGISIVDVVSQTNALLPPEASELLSVLAVAGRPMVPKLALRAAGVRTGGRNLVHALRGLNLVRTRDVVGERLVEVYHDRVRESVQSTLSPAELERIHGTLLAALEHSGRADPDWLHVLALGAAQPLPALRYGLVAAERARSTLAFERAAELYRRCLALSPDDAPNRGEQWRKLATVLGQSGKGAQAAEALLEAAKYAGPDEAIALRRSAASHLLRSGRFAEGEALLQQVLAAMEIEVPDTEAGLTAAIVWERCRLRMRGLRFTRRSEQQVPAALLARVDMCEALRAETLATDALRAALFQARGMRWALEAGEPMRVVRALSSAATIAAVSNSDDAAARTDELLAMAGQIAQELDTPSARASVLSARAFSEFMLGRMRNVIEPAYEAERMLRTLANDSDDAGYYLRQAIVSARIGAFIALGEYRRFVEELGVALEGARVTDNRAALLQLALNETIADEILGRPGDAVVRLEQQRQQLPAGRFAILHLLHMVAVGRIACRTERYDWGVPLFEADWERYRRSPVRHSTVLASLAHSTRARLLLNRHAAQPGSTPIAKLVASDLKALARLPSWSRALGLGLQARVALAQDRRELALEQLKRNVAQYPLGSAAEADVTSYALGLLLGNDEGAELCAVTERTMREAGIVDPLAYARSFYPELFPRR
jgi:serine/threonine protein kinase/tetratricopeptide (TPR) repeat protein